MVTRYFLFIAYNFIVFTAVFPLKNRLKYLRFQSFKGVNSLLKRNLVDLSKIYLVLKTFQKIQT